MSAPQNSTTTPHRGLPVITPHRGIPMVERRAPTPVGYVGAHRFAEGETPAQFTVGHLVKMHKVTRGLQA